MIKHIRIDCRDRLQESTAGIDERRGKTTWEKNGTDRKHWQN